MTPEDGRIIPAPATQARSRLKLIDCDVHHALRSSKDLFPYLATRWHRHLEQFGARRPIPFTGSSPYPKTRVRQPLPRRSSRPKKYAIASKRANPLRHWYKNFQPLNAAMPGKLACAGQTVTRPCLSMQAKRLRSARCRNGCARMQACICSKFWSGVSMGFLTPRCSTTRATSCCGPMRP